MDYSKLNARILVLGLLGVASIIVMVIGTMLVLNYVEKIHNYEPEVSSKSVTLFKYVAEPKDFDEEKLARYLVELNVAHPEIVFAQAVVESGNFKSKIFQENNNMFGMKEARVRSHTALGTNRGHAVYRNWKECVIDYALYQSRYLPKLSRKEYLEYLGARYAEDPGYKNKIEKLSLSYISKFKELKNEEKSRNS